MPHDVTHTQTLYSALGERLTGLQQVTSRPGREFLGFETAADEALPAWHRLRSLTVQSGFYPLIVRDPKSLMFGDERDRGIHPHPEYLIREAEALDVEAWIAAERIQAGGPPRKPGDTCTCSDRFEVLYDAESNSPSGGLYILLVPTLRPEHIPAYLGIGGWNCHPAPHVHVAMLRRSHERFGAELVTAMHDTLELYCTMPPKTLPQALELAEEHYLYCDDIIYQGVGSIAALAYALVRSPHWYFWWD